MEPVDQCIVFLWDLYDTVSLLLPYSFGGIAYVQKDVEKYTIESSSDVN